MVSVSEKAVEASVLESLEAHREELRGHRVLLFGSRARGEASRLSDFDLGVDGSGALDLSAFYEIKDSLDRIPTLYPIDWVDLKRASSKLRENALREGRVLYEA